MRIRSVAVFLLLSSILLFPAFLVQTKAATALRKVTLISFFGTDTIGMVSLYVSVGLGFFAQEGLDVSIEFSKGTGDAVALTAAGKGDFGTADPGAIMTGVANGANVIDVFTWFQADMQKLAVLDDSPYKQITDLKGKDVGVTFLGSTAHYALVRQLKLAGMSEDSVKIVGIGMGTGAVEALFQHKVDAYMTPSIGTLLYLSQSKGVKINILPSKGVAIPSIGIITSNAFLRSDRNTVVGVGRAMAKGIAYTIANSTASNDIIGKLHPELLSDRDWAEFNTKWQAAQLITEDGKNHPIGWHDPQAWSAAQTLYQDLGLIPKSVNAQNCYTNDLLADMNDFDRSAVEGMAQSMVQGTQRGTPFWTFQSPALQGLILVVAVVAATIVIVLRKHLGKAKS